MYHVHILYKHEVSGYAMISIEYESHCVGIEVYMGFRFCNVSDYTR